MESPPSNLSIVKDVIDIISGVIVAVAAIIGGLWALLRYRKERTDEAAIEIGVNSTCAPYGQDYLIFLDIKLTNKGRTKIQAKYERSNGLAFDDGVERLQHSGSLQVKQVLPRTQHANSHLDWFESPLLRPLPDIAEINLLTEYEDPTRSNRIDFWMEPGEVYHLEAAIVLSPGLYLAKITFVGADGDDNFWSRLHLIQVPEQVPSKQPPDTKETT
jgi:hypothetical protein